GVWSTAWILLGGGADASAGLLETNSFFGGGFGGQSVSLMTQSSSDSIVARTVLELTELLSSVRRAVGEPA
ncbi:unnamed protein product, partial [Sphagnum tenellum]